MKNPECLAIDLDIYNVYLIFDSKYMYIHWYANNLHSVNMLY